MVIKIALVTSKGKMYTYNKKKKKMRADQIFVVQKAFLVSYGLYNYMYTFFPLMLLVQFELPSVMAPMPIFMVKKQNFKNLVSKNQLNLE